MLREMKESGVKWIGKIPNEWIVSKVKYLGCSSNGLTYSPADVCDENEGILVLRSSNIQNGKFSYLDNVYVKSAPKSLEVLHGDIVICSRNGSAELVGKCAIVEEDIHATYGAFMLRFHPLCNNKYVYYLLTTTITNYKSLFATTTINQLTQSVLNNMSLPYTYDITEQQAIANYLDGKCAKIDRLLDDLDAEVKTLAEYKKSIIDESVKRGLNPNVPMKKIDLGWIEYIPKHWELARIASVYSVRNDKVSDKDFPPLSVTMKGILPQLESAAKTKHGDDRKLIRKGDFVINSRSDRRGACGISPYDGSCSLINTVLTPREEMNPRYYNWLFHTSSFADEFYKWGYGIVNDLWTTNWGAMRRIQIPVPPLDEQETIATYLDNRIPQIEETINDKQRQIDTLKSYKASLIYEYVTGKKQVKL